MGLWKCMERICGRAADDWRCCFIAGVATCKGLAIGAVLKHVLV